MSHKQSHRLMRFPVALGANASLKIASQPDDIHGGRSHQAEQIRTHKSKRSEAMTPPSCYSAAVLCIWLISAVTTAQAPVVLTGHFNAAVKPVLLSNASSSEVVNVTGVKTRLKCVARCVQIGCLMASHDSSSQLCQLVLVNNASGRPGPDGTHVQRLLGSDSGARLWTASRFKELLAKSMLNVSFEVRNCGVGRNGSIQSLTIPSTGCYKIEVSGARGGTNSFAGKAGGNGAVMTGAFDLTAGTQLTVVVGQAGGPPRSLHSGGGGGGGSFVYRTDDDFLLAAAGGGGAGSYFYTGLPGEAGVNGSDMRPYGDRISYGGINGQPGFSNPSAMPDTHNHGGCGAGWLGEPVNPRRATDDGGGGGSRVEGWVGGLAGDGNSGVGGFGGGGGGGGVMNQKWGAAGAGGGYSGGGTGYSTSPPGGGGGSFCSGSGCQGVTGVNAGQHGQVIVRLLTPLGDSCD